MRILCCGSRKYNDYKYVSDVLDNIGISDPIFITGGAKGLDSLVKKWADENGVHCAVVEALWDTFDKAAGPIRNKAMLLLQPDLVLAFMDNAGPGTINMVTLANSRGIKVKEV